MSRRGFTLLEVMVALSILALALTSLAGIDANSFKSSNYSKHVTVATLLARSKMIDVEELVRKDGFSESDKDYSGDFEKEGFPNFKWAATCRMVEMDVGQLIGSLVGGDVSPEALPEKIQGYLGALTGKSGDKELTDKVAGSDLSKMLGGGQMEAVFKGVGETLKKSIREITLEIRWGDTEKAAEKDQESIVFVQYVVQGGRLSFNFNQAIAAQQAAAAQKAMQAQQGPLGPDGKPLPVNPSAPPRFPLGPNGQQLPGHRPAPFTSLPGAVPAATPVKK